MTMLNERKLHTKRTATEQLEKTIDKLEKILDEGKKFPPFGSIVRVQDAKKCLNQLNEDIYEVLKEDKRIVQKSEDIVKRNNMIIRKTEKDAQAMIDKHHEELWSQPILVQAEEKAKEILREAKKKSQEILSDAERVQAEAEN
mgnify:CR=1 FL=1